MYLLHCQSNQYSSQMFWFHLYPIPSAILLCPKKYVNAPVNLPVICYRSECTALLLCSGFHRKRPVTSWHCAPSVFAELLHHQVYLIPDQLCRQEVQPEPRDPDPSSSPTQKRAKNTWLEIMEAKYNGTSRTWRSKLTKRILFELTRIRCMGL